MKRFKVFACFLMAIVMTLTIGLVAGCGGNAELEHIEGTAGVKYRLSEDGTHYIWSGIDPNCTEKDIVVGNWHEGLPVTETLNRHDRNEDENFNDLEINSLTLSEGITSLAYGCLANKHVKKVVLPDGIELFPQALMIFQTQLEEIVIGKGLKEMDVDVLMSNDGHLQKIYFRGTEAEWKAVVIAEKGNDDFINCTNIVYNYKG